MRRGQFPFRDGSGNPIEWSPASPAYLGLSTESPSLRALCVEPEEIQELSDLVIELRGMAHVNGAVESIAVPPAFTLARDVARLDQFGDDALRRPLRDPHSPGDVAKPHVGITLDTEKYLGVARKEVPVLGFTT